jgi:amphi-Trp domain-containing protein
MAEELELEVNIPAEEVADILDRIAAGMRRGLVRVRASHRQVVLQPPERVKMYIDGAADGLHVNLAWGDS